MQSNAKEAKYFYIGQDSAWEYFAPVEKQHKNIIL